MNVLKRLLAVLFRERHDREMDRDITEHLDLAAAEFQARGMSPESARREARRRFGPVAQVREEMRSRRGIGWLDRAERDFRQAFRGLGRTPGFTAASILMLAVALGMSTAAISVLDGVLLDALPYDRPHELLALGVVEQTDEGLPEADNQVSLPVFRDLGRVLESLDVAAVFYGGSARIAYDGPFEEVAFNVVSANFFGVLGIEPALGRLDALGESPGGGTQPVVIDFGYWQDHYGGRPEVIGEVLRLDGHEPMSIVGVLPLTFRAPSSFANRIPLWASLDFVEPSPYSIGQGQVFGRLREGETPESAAAELAVLSGGFASDLGIPGAWAGSFEEELVGSSRPLITILLLAAGLLLLIAGLNLMGLQVSRLTDRRDELAVRAALGASRRDLARAAVAESIVLALSGAVLGAGVLGISFEVILRNVPENLLARLDNVRVEPWTFVATILLALLVALIVGSISSYRAAHKLDVDIRRTPDKVSESPAQRRLLGVTLGSQTALAVALAVIAALLIQSQYLEAARYGAYDTSGVMTARVDLPPGYRVLAYRSTFISDVLAALVSLPGAEAVSMSSSQLGSSNFGAERVETGERDRAFTVFSEVSADFGRSLGIVPLEGRWHTGAEIGSNAPVVVISRELASHFWPESSALGRSLYRTSDERRLRVVGVVPGRDSGLSQGADVYMPYTSGVMTETHETLYFFVRASSSVAVGMRERIEALEPNSRVTLSPLASLVATQTRTSRFMAILSSGLSSAALLMALVGMYGVLAYRMARRTREIGLRMALGASPHIVVREVVGRARVAPLVGVAAGLAFSIVLVRVMGQYDRFTSLPGLLATPYAHAAAAAVSIALVMLALWIPARRAAAVDPLRALRHE